jgi:polyphosphate kinase 2 (PPK2 family)
MGLMKTKTKEFLVRAGDVVDLKQRPTVIAPARGSKGEYKQLLDEHIGRLSSLQELLYAANRYSVLVIFQAMDAAGKDGAIKHVMSGVNPQGCQVIMTFCGGPPASSRNGAGSVYSTGRTTKKS